MDGEGLGQSLLRAFEEAPDPRQRLDERGLAVTNMACRAYTNTDYTSAGWLIPSRIIQRPRAVAADAKPKSHYEDSEYDSLKGECPPNGALDFAVREFIARRVWDAKLIQSFLKAQKAVGDL